MNAIKTLLMALVMLCGAPAFADSECYDGKGGTFFLIGSTPCPSVKFTGRVVRAHNYNPDSIFQQEQRRIVTTRRESQPELPPGYERIPCDFWEKLKKEFVVNGLNALKGGLVGAGLGDDSRSAGIGAALGLFFGPSAGPCYVIVPPEHKEAIVKKASEFTGRPIPAEEQVGGTEGGHDEVKTSLPKSKKVETTTLPSGGAQDTCRLRVNGKVVAEIKLPLSVQKEQSREICDEWQLREAKSRGLI